MRSPSPRFARSKTRSLFGLVAVVALVVACAGDDDDDSDSVMPPVVDGEPFPDERCARNREAGTITYLSGFDFAAAASIIDVVVAEDRGYFDELCLDVELQPSFSSDNYRIIAGGGAEFASGGSVSEVVENSLDSGSELIVVGVDGRTAIDALILKPGTAATLEDLAGTTIGVKGRIPPSVEAMLAGAGLVEGEDYETVLLDGFDPLAHYATDGIVGFPGYKSNEPGQLERAGLPFDIFDPTEYGVPGSFGVIFANAVWARAHGTVVSDFMRATMRGLEDAIADPETATQIAIDLVEANGNPSFLSLDGESYRWATDAELLVSQLPPDRRLGVPEVPALQEEVEAYAEVGLFDGQAPDVLEFVNPTPVKNVYEPDGTVTWPS